ncbi:DUF7576 family protein [Haladaptatus halobius]|uniref:DUF7576 family protein n=1 Tax=Haladaptatus halobius TaxID=2884875 RepID=UPI003F63F13B
MIEKRTAVESDKFEAQYVGCVYCSTLIDLTESHPVIFREESNEFDERVSVSCHFCSNHCRTQWKLAKGYDPDSAAY